MQQLPLAIHMRDQVSFANFYASVANQQAIAYLQNFFTQVGEHVVYLWSAPQQGRTHLLHACCQLAKQKKIPIFYLPLKNLDQLRIEVLQNLADYDVVCLDDIDYIIGNREWEEALFHLYNRLQVQQRYLLVTAACAPSALQLTLADLHSRLSASTVFHLQSLTDREKLAMLQLRAAQRGLTLADAVGQFLLNHWPRDNQALFTALDTLDKASWASQHYLTVPFVKATLKL